MDRLTLKGKTVIAVTCCNINLHKSYKSNLEVNKFCPRLCETSVNSKNKITNLYTLLNMNFICIYLISEKKKVRITMLQSFVMNNVCRCLF